jgi:hypothetical protein
MQVVNPTYAVPGEAAMVGHGPPAEGRRGARLTMLSNAKPNVEEFFAGIGSWLEGGLGVAYEIFAKPNPTMPAPAEVLEKAAEDACLALVAIGD